MMRVYATIFRVGRVTVFLTGLAVVLAVISTLVLGATSMAFAANGKPFVLGKTNVASAVSTLKKQGPGPALRIIVGDGQPPLSVNSDVRVPNLNADKVDGQDAEAFLGAGASAGGDLSGAYPDPEISNGAVGAGEIDSSQVQRRVLGSCQAGTAVSLVGLNGDLVCRSTGLTGFETVTASSAYNDVRLKSVDAQCPSGKFLLSGGGEYSSSPTGITAGFTDDVALYNNGPVVASGSQRWRAGSRWLGEGTPPQWRVIGYAICANR